MAASDASYRTPYAESPGSSTPPPETKPSEGISDFWAFFWLTLLNTAIIAVAGIATWLIVH